MTLFESVVTLPVIGVLAMLTQKLFIQPTKAAKHSVACGFKAKMCRGVLKQCIHAVIRKSEGGRIYVYCATSRRCICYLFG